MSLKFCIVRVDNGEGVIYRGKPLIYDSPEEAKAYIARKARETGIKYKIKAMGNDDSWKEREAARMETRYIKVPFAPLVFWQVGIGNYTKEMVRIVYPKYLPICGRYKHHYAHVSSGDRMMLAYTKDGIEGARDIQTRISPGSYLAKYYGEVLSAGAIKDLVNQWTVKYTKVELKFARTPEEIIKIYQTGPSSCMSGVAENYSAQNVVTKKRHHPLEVYGLPHSDLTLAYIKNDKGIVSRVLVWEREKRYGRIYGDHTLIKRELESLGYRDRNFHKATLRKIPLGDGRIVMPYVDGWSYVRDCGGYLELAGALSEDEKVSGGNTCGWAVSQIPYTPVMSERTYND